MKKILFIIIMLSVAVSTDLLQEGIYPECSYLEVTADGWRIHKNYEGRVLSMKAPGSHDSEKGKYSFDKFGNLIPYTECQITETVDKKSKKSTKVDVDVKFDFSKFNPTFSVNGGVSMPLGDNLTYEIGYHYGLNFNPNFSGFLKNISFSFMGMNLPNEDGNQSSLTSTGLFTNYTLTWKKINLVGGVGMINQEGALMPDSVGVIEDTSGGDMGLYGEFGLNLNKKMTLYASSIYTTTFLGEDQTSTYYNFGLKYNF